MAKSYKRSYNVFSADPITTDHKRDLDGEMVTIRREVTSVQLIADDGSTITFNVPKDADHPFFEGERVTATFARED